MILLRLFGVTMRFSGGQFHKITIVYDKSKLEGSFLIVEVDRKLIHYCIYLDSINFDDNLQLASILFDVEEFSLLCILG